MMRAKVALLNPDPREGVLIPFNYNYFLSSAIMHALRIAEYDIHGREVLYTFSLLFGGKPTKQGILVKESAYFVFSTPNVNELKAFIEGMLSLHISTMEIEIPANRESLLILSEKVRELEENGVKVKVVLESDNFLGETKTEIGELAIELKPDSKLIKVLEEAYPLFTVTGAQKVHRDGKTEWIRAQLVIWRGDEVKMERLKCPFCGYEDSYVTNYEGVAIPRSCRGCGAGVHIRTNIYENLVPPEAEIVKDDGNRVIFLERYTVEEESGKLVLRESNNVGIAILIDEDEFPEFNVYAVFSHKLTEISEKDVRDLVEGIMVKRGAFKPAFEHEVKKPSSTGKAKLVYIPSQWKDAEEVLVVKLPPTED